jgi:hypothetical protein
MALNGVYRFLYYFVMKKIPIKDVPSGLEEYVFDLDGVELGKYALQLPPPSDTKVAPLEEGAATGGLSKPHYSVDLSAIELQPLIQRVESIEINNSKNFESIDSRFESTDSRFDGIDSRFDGIDSRFDGIDSRFDGLDATLAGILQALKVQTASPVQQLKPLRTPNNDS